MPSVSAFPHRGRSLDYRGDGRFSAFLGQHYWTSAPGNRDGEGAQSHPSGWLHAHRCSGTGGALAAASRCFSVAVAGGRSEDASGGGSWGECAPAPDDPLRSGTTARGAGTLVFPFECVTEEERHRPERKAMAGEMNLVTPFGHKLSPNSMQTEKGFSES